jgi:hypothetical protein
VDCGTLQRAMGGKWSPADPASRVLSTRHRIPSGDMRISDARHDSPRFDAFWWCKTRVTRQCALTLFNAPFWPNDHHSVVSQDPLRNVPRIRPSRRDSTQETSQSATNPDPMTCGLRKAPRHLERLRRADQFRFVGPRRNAYVRIIRRNYQNNPLWKRPAFLPEYRDARFRGLWAVQEWSMVHRFWV